MKIEQVQIHEYKILKDVEFLPKGHNVLIVGENGLGKSTIIQFLEIALGKQTNIPPGAEGDGVVVINKDGSKYTLKVKIKEGKPTVTVITEGGMKDSRKGAIASLVGPTEFDVENFIQLSKTKAGRKEQIEIVKGFFPEDTRNEIRKYENNLIAIEEERTDIGRMQKTLKGSIESNPLINSDLKGYKQIDISAVADELKVANEHNSKVDEVNSRKESRSLSIKKEVDLIAERKIEIEKKLEEIKEIESKLKKSSVFIEEETNKNIQADKWIKENPKKDVSSFEETIRSATDTNNRYNSSQLLIKDIERLEELTNEYGEHTVKIELTRQAIADTVRDIGLPVDDLMFDEESLIYKGLPVHPDSQSESEIMELGAKLKFCENPELGILLLERTESIGQKRWENILSMCKEKEWQIIGEYVKRGEEKLKIEISAE